MGKVVFAVLLLLLCTLILLGGGGLIFRVAWRQPWSLAVLAIAYACCAAALMAVLVALVPDERRAGALNSVVAMGLGLAGGCMFPPQSLPAFLREHITPLLPTYWFTDTARNLQFSSSDVPWMWTVIKLVVLSTILLAIAALLFRRLLRAGVRT